MDAADLEQLRVLTSMDRAAVLATVGARAGDIDDGYSYQPMQNLSVLNLPKRFGTRVFFDGAAVAVVAVADPPIRPDDICLLMGGDVVELRSRQGKRAMIELDAAGGLASPVTTTRSASSRCFLSPPTTTTALASGSSRRRSPSNARELSVHVAVSRGREEGAFDRA